MRLEVVEHDDGWSVELPIHTVSESNQREHYAVRHARRKRQRGDAARMLQAYMPLCREHSAIELTRIAPRSLDTDNLRGALKGVMDGVADWLGIDDGDPRLSWHHEQEKAPRPRYYAVRVRVRPGMRFETKAVEVSDE